MSADRTILVLDDNPDNRKLVMLFLGAKGFAVIGAASARDADEQVRLHQPKLAVVDVALPEEDGLGWVQRTRTQGGGPAWVLALTAHGDPDVRERALAAGCDAFLTKPAPLSTLLSLVEDCFAGRAPGT